MTWTISSLVASSRSSDAASAISSVARGPTMWTPRTSSYFSSPTTFTMPSFEPRIFALELAEKGNTPVFTL